MPHRSGTAGQVDSPSSVSGIRAWNLEYTVDMLETTDFADSGVSSFIAGKTQWSGSFSGFKEGTPQAITTGSIIVLKLYETQQSNEFWTGDAFITAVRVVVDNDGLVSYDYDFQGTAALTVAAA